jgi:hypothetical protein
MQPYITIKTSYSFISTHKFMSVVVSLCVPGSIRKGDILAATIPNHLGRAKQAGPKHGQFGSARARHDMLTCGSCRHEACFGLYMGLHACSSCQTRHDLFRVAQSGPMAGSFSPTRHGPPIKMK